jgi:hypothetical protein
VFLVRSTSDETQNGNISLCDNMGVDHNQNIDMRSVFAVTGSATSLLNRFILPFNPILIGLFSRLMRRKVKRPAFVHLARKNSHCLEARI